MGAGPFLYPIMINIDLHKTHTTILSVDDSPDKSALMSLLLRHAGYHVVTALDGREGLEIAKLEIPDLIISDVSMPVMGGVELCRHVRADQRLRTVPIMLVTAMQKDTDSVARGLAAGADDYLEVPFDPERLIARVARLIERKRTEEPLARLASIVENSEESIIGTTLEGTITSWNFGAERVYGYIAAEVLGRSVFSIIPADRREELEGILNEISNGLSISRFQTRRLRKDGKVIDVSVTASPIKDARHKVIGASAISRDITEQILAEMERERLIKELQDALAEVKTLRGILPICMTCKKIRDDEGTWRQLEAYISEHTDANFSHGMCEPCAQNIYPEIYEKLQRDESNRGGS
jgi:PAS domain S-box-containing protein